MKKIINNPKDYLNEMIEGVVANEPTKLARLEGFDVIVRKNINKNKVALVSGGGAGHEPAHAGFVGEGMLDAAIIGPVFTSPTPNQIEAAVNATTGDKGALIIIKSYTGDRLNFEAGQMLLEVNGIKMSKVIVGDDVAIEDTSKTAGARGLAGTIFIHKIAGALAETGASLEEVTKVAQEVADSVRTMGVGLSACVVPAAGKESFSLEDDEMELGLGIHGEPGIKKVKLETASEIVDHLLKSIMRDDFYKGSEVAVMVNGLGGTPISELHILNNDLQKALVKKNVKVARTYVGNYVTSLEMKGASISLLKLTPKTKKLLNAKADTLSWKEVA
ncbi:MAG: dihydroxyacetone kinase subunit DhaK [Mycoplasmataceae bacterium]|nr:dihydroxyacetone kinase subunit DhaK [Mycoplasmataceae bacterium]